MAMTALPPPAYRLAHTVLRASWRIRRPRSLGVKVIALHDDRVILVRHHYGDRRWMLPGGGIKRRESITECLRRELREETGHDVGDLAEQAVIVGVFESTAEHKHDMVIVPRLMLPSEPTIKPCNEIAEVTLVSLDDLPDDLSPSTRALLGSAREHAFPVGHWGQ